MCALREAVQAARTNHAFGGCPKGSATKRDTVKLIGDAVLSIAESATPNAGGDLDAGPGGPLRIRGTGDFTLTNIRQNAASARLLEIEGGNVTLQQVTLESGGLVESGGGILATDNAKLLLLNAEVINSTAQLRGGGIACEGCKKLTLDHRFAVNANSVASATDDVAGGGIWTDAPTILRGDPIPPIPVSQSSIAGNTANPGAGNAALGGGIYSTSKLTISETTIGSNSAIDRAVGGGIHSTGNLSLKRVTVTENDASGGGGGISVQSPGKLNVKNSAVVDNDANGSSDTGAPSPAASTCWKPVGRSPAPASTGTPPPRTPPPTRRRAAASSYPTPTPTRPR